MASDQFNSIQLLSLNEPTEENLLQQNTAMTIWVALRLAEESFFRQRSRIRWIGEGDFNTPLFHNSMLEINGYNTVKLLIRADGSIASTNEEIHKYAVRYFKEVICNIKGMFCSDLPLILLALDMSVCSDQHCSALTAPVPEETIKRSLNGLPSRKNPGPCGFTA